MNTYGELIGYLAGICTALCFLPQSLRTFRKKKVRGLSALSYAFYSFGILCWIIYGAYLGSIQMIVFNLISLCFALPIFVMIIKYGQKKNIFAKIFDKLKKRYYL